MSKRLFAILGIPIGLAACERMATTPESQPDAEAVAPSVSRMNLSAIRRADLGGAVADARMRLLPAISEESGERAALGTALQRLDQTLSADDGAGVLQAVASAEAALAAVPEAEAESISSELDAIRLLLGELRASATSGGSTVEQ
jgi:hypothetical protein